MLAGSTIQSGVPVWVTLSMSITMQNKVVVRPCRCISIHRAQPSRPCILLSTDLGGNASSRSLGLQSVLQNSSCCCCSCSRSRHRCWYRCCCRRYCGSCCCYRCYHCCRCRCRFCCNKCRSPLVIDLIIPRLDFFYFVKLW